MLKARSGGGWTGSASGIGTGIASAGGSSGSGTGIASGGGG
jgi:hypothetical protein